jgi:hypothetical protein
MRTVSLLLLLPLLKGVALFVNHDSWRAWTEVRARDGRIGPPCRAFIQKQEDNGGGKIAMIFGQHLANLITAAKLQ